MVVFYIVMGIVIIAAVVVISGLSPLGRRFKARGAINPRDLRTDAMDQYPPDSDASRFL